VSAAATVDTFELNLVIDDDTVAAALDAFDVDLDKFPDGIVYVCGC
jgi:hypothetical protein